MKRSLIHSMLVLMSSGVAVSSAQAATVTVGDGTSNTATCTLSTMSVNSTGDQNITCTSGSLVLSGSTTTTTTPPPTDTTTPPPTDTTVTNPASDTGGYGSGPLKLATTADGRDIYIEDPAIPTGPAAYVPGCLNGQSAPNSSTGCAALITLPGFTNVTMQKATNELAIRFKPLATAASTSGYFLMNGALGGGVGAQMNMWLTTDPTATYAATPSVCKVSAATTPLVMTAGSKCPVNTSSLYYLKISMPNSCTTLTCRWQLTVNKQFE